MAPTPVKRRVLARVLLDIGRDAGLLGFSAADTHMHVLTALARAETMELMRRVEITLQRRLRLGFPFDRARPRPIYNQWHLGSCPSASTDPDILMGLHAKMKKRSRLCRSASLGFGGTQRRALLAGRSPHHRKVLRYIHPPGERHGLARSDVWEATSLPDLLKMRPVGSYLIARVKRHLPRLTRGELMAQAGLASLEPAWAPVIWSWRRP